METIRRRTGAASRAGCSGTGGFAVALPADTGPGCRLRSGDGAELPEPADRGVDSRDGRAPFLSLLPAQQTSVRIENSFAAQGKSTDRHHQCSVVSQCLKLFFKSAKDIGMPFKQFPCRAHEEHRRGDGTQQACLFGIADGENNSRGLTRLNGSKPVESVQSVTDDLALAAPDKLRRH